MYFCQMVNKVSGLISLSHRQELSDRGAAFDSQSSCGHFKRISTECRPHQMNALLLSNRRGSVLTKWKSVLVMVLHWGWCSTANCWRRFAIEQIPRLPRVAGWQLELRVAYSCLVRRELLGVLHASYRLTRRHHTLCVDGVPRRALGASLEPPRFAGRGEHWRIRSEHVRVAGGGGIASRPVARAGAEADW